MKTFKERLEERVREGYRKSGRLIGCDEERAALAGARAVLLLLAEELVENRRLYRTHNEASAIQGVEHEDWLRTRAKELSDG